MSRRSSDAVPARVTTYSGCRADERPLTFTLNAGTHHVARVTARYLRLHTNGKRSRGFVVNSTEGGKYRLEHRIDSGEWFVAILRPSSR